MQFTLCLVVSQRDSNLQVIEMKSQLTNVRSYTVDATAGHPLLNHTVFLTAKKGFKGPLPHISLFRSLHFFLPNDIIFLFRNRNRLIEGGWNEFAGNNFFQGVVLREVCSRNVK